MKKYKQLNKKDIAKIRQLNDGQRTVRRIAKEVGTNRVAVLKALQLPAMRVKTKQGLRVVPINSFFNIEKK